MNVLPFQDIYLVFEFMDTDLHNVIKKGNILTEVRYDNFAFNLPQILIFRIKCQTLIRTKLGELNFINLTQTIEICF